MFWSIKKASAGQTTALAKHISGKRNLKPQNKTFVLCGCEAAETSSGTFGGGTARRGTARHGTEGAGSTAGEDGGGRGGHMRPGGGQRYWGEGGGTGALSPQPVCSRGQPGAVGCWGCGVRGFVGGRARGAPGGDGLWLSVQEGGCRLLPARGKPARNADCGHPPGER